MATDPKSQARRAQDAAAEAKAAAKAAAVARAKAEAKAESQEAPSVVNTDALTPPNVPLDVFTGSPSSSTARKADAGERELTSDQERIAEASGAGRAGARNAGKPGEVADPDLASMGGPSGRKGPGGPSSGENPFGDRAAALRDTPASAENPLDSFGKIDSAGDRIREATGRDGGLGGAADRLSPFAENPATPQNPGFGKGSVSDEGQAVLATGAIAIASAAAGGAALVAGAPAVAGVAAVTGVAAVVSGTGILAADSALGDALVIDSLVDTAVQFTELNSAEEIQANIEFNKAARAHADRQAAGGGTPTLQTEPIMPLVPIVGGAAGGGKKGVKDPGPEGEDTPLPPGMIGGDLLLPPSLRTGANVAGAKGSDGIDWAHHRGAATNPSREDTGGGGKETYIQRAGKNSLISQPERDDGAGGGGMNGISGSGTPQNSGGSTDPEDGSAWTGPTRAEDPGPINTTSSEGVLAGVFNSDDDDDDDDFGSRD